MEAENPKVLVVMGSDSDFDVMKSCLKTLKKFNIGFDCRVCSAHRTPAEAAELASTAADKGYGAIIAAAGMAAHLPGVLAAFTILPVIGVPIKSNALDGMDALLAMAQMPPGIPVATVAINGAMNSAILAAQILEGKYPQVAEAMKEYKKEMREKVLAKDQALQNKIAEEI